MDVSHRNLLIDIGNSGFKAALYVGGEISGPIVRPPEPDWAVLDAMVTNLGVENVIYSTVANVPPGVWVDKWKSAGLGVFSLRDLPLPFVSDYETMETLGQDRIAAVAGSIGLVTGPRLIVDAGSCLTLDLVTAENRYLGGNISPGLNMRLRAMHEFTANLPLLAPASPRGRIGRSTAGAMLHGGGLGLVYEIEGLFARLRPEYPELQILLTGGDAAWIRAHLELPHIFYPNLVLRGLHQTMSNYVNNHS